ncbi:MAG: hypothetical protein JJE46_00290 [Acidimicrobiia bacterium]|nr:hypothetical protein [Acidimicrobiia bacterium]
MDGDISAPIRRVLTALGSDDAVEVLAEQTGGSDLTSFLLEVMRRRAGRSTPSDLMRQYRRDRFVEPGAVDARALHRMTATMIDSIPSSFKFVELAPVIPLGSHSVLAPVHQDKVVSGTRNLEVAADPTVALAIVAAHARGDASAPTVHLAAVQRILRAQPFGTQGQPHFSVMALLSAGRDAGHLAFEAAAIGDHLRALVAAIAAVTGEPVEIRLTDLRADDRPTITDAAHAALAPLRHVTVADDPGREAGRGYYRDLCFKVIVRPGPDEVEIGDGGFTDWTAQLLENRKERLLTSGLGLDRLVTVASEPA